MFPTTCGSLLLGAVVGLEDVDFGESLLLSSRVGWVEDGADSLLVGSGGEICNNTCLTVESAVGCINVDACSFWVGFV